MQIFGGNKQITQEKAPSRAKNNLKKPLAKKAGLALTAAAIQTTLATPPLISSKMPDLPSIHAYHLLTGADDYTHVIDSAALGSASIAPSDLPPVEAHHITNDVRDQWLTDLLKNTDQQKFETFVTLPGVDKETALRLETANEMNTNQSPSFTFSQGKGSKWISVNNLQEDSDAIPARNPEENHISKALGRCPHNMITTTLEIGNLAKSSIQEVMENPLFAGKHFTLNIITSNSGNGLDANTELEHQGFKQVKTEGKTTEFVHPDYQNLQINLVIADGAKAFASPIEAFKKGDKSTAILNGARQIFNTANLFDNPDKVNPVDKYIGDKRTFNWGTDDCWQHQDLVMPKNRKELERKRAEELSQNNF